MMTQSWDNVNLDGQMELIDYLASLDDKKIINKPIRLIETFAGYGSQSMALQRIGADFEHYKVVEFDKYAVNSYNAVHGTNFDATDIRDVHADDLEIVDTDKYTYLLTYLLFSLHRLINSWASDGNEQGFRYKKWSVMGS